MSINANVTNTVTSAGTPEPRYLHSLERCDLNHEGRSHALLS